MKNCPAIIRLASKRTAARAGSRRRGEVWVDLCNWVVAEGGKNMSDGHAGCHPLIPV